DFQHAVDGASSPVPRRVVVPGDHHRGDARSLDAADLHHEVAHRVPVGPALMEDVATVDDEVHLLTQDVVDGGREGQLHVDRALVATRQGILLRQGAIAEMGVADVRDPERACHRLPATYRSTRRYFWVCAQTLPRLMPPEYWSRIFLITLTPASSS